MNLADKYSLGIVALGISAGIGSFYVGTTYGAKIYHLPETSKFYAIENKLKNVSGLKVLDIEKNHLEKWREMRADYELYQKLKDTPEAHLREYYHKKDDAFSIIGMGFLTLASFGAFRLLYLSERNKLNFGNDVSQEISDII